MNGLSFRELFDYSAAENEKWHRWVAAQPVPVLDLPYAEPPLATVRQLVRHIGFVEHRYAAILAGAPVPAAPGSETDDADAVFVYLAESRRQLEQSYAAAEQSGLEREIEFMTLTAGPQRASARKVVGHALIHGMRHWAQLATVLREQGHRTDWSHDLLLSAALR
jgi:uncharacterized damage-inducible protein DinB